MNQSPMTAPMSTDSTDIFHPTYLRMLAKALKVEIKELYPAGKR